MIVPPQPDAQTERLAENTSFGAENCPGIIDLATSFRPVHDLLQTSSPIPEAIQNSFQGNGPLELPAFSSSSSSSSSQDFRLSEYGIFNPSCDPPMSFRDRHRFLDGVYNSYSDPDWITAKDMRDIARRAGLLMDEVLLWFEDEKSRRQLLLANNQHQAQKIACQFPPSPESIRASCEFSSASSSYNATSPGTSSQPPEIFSPCLASMDEKLLVPPKPKRGRPAKTQIKTEPDLSSPDAKRKKISVKYPCPDCGNFVAAERWAEHIDRKHFPENVWECPKINRRTEKPCSSNPHYRPSYRHDNFATHLKSEHGCPDSEVVELKKTCRFEVADFFHKVCGFCDKSLGSRDESIEHIKEHFRETSQQQNPPADLGVSMWREKCCSEHKLQLGIHYRRSRASKSDLTDEDNDHEKGEDGDGDEDGGSGEGNLDNPGHDTSDFQPNNNSRDQDHDDDGRSGESSSDNRGHVSLAPFEQHNISQMQDGGSGHDTSSAGKFEHAPVPHTITSTRQRNSCDHCSRHFTRRENLGRHVKDGCSKGADIGSLGKVKIPPLPSISATRMVSTADHKLNMLSRHMTDDKGELEFPLQPDPSNTCSQPLHSNRVQKYNKDTSYLYPRTQEGSSAISGLSSSTVYAEAPQYESPDLRSAPSNYPTASGPSANSSIMRSPHSIHGQTVPGPEYGLGLNPSTVSYDDYRHNEYTFPASGIKGVTLEFNLAKTNPNGFFDPLVLHPYAGRPSSATQSNEASPDPLSPQYPALPSFSQISRSPRNVKQGSQSPYLSSYGSSYLYPPPRRPSLNSNLSLRYENGNFSSEESKGKGRCTYPNCGKLFKDLKAHMLSHQIERPEKCPIQTCDYHIKGFARKYDKNRHTLTHYKGTIMCGFCPGSGSAAGKSFNRVDVFKRHLFSTHAVEQTPPNSRKKISGNIDSTKKHLGYAPDATGKCSTCSSRFSNAQELYEHLDDCVLQIVQIDELSKAINAARIPKAGQDQTVRETLRSNSLPGTTASICSADEDENEEDFDERNDDYFTLRSKASRKGRGGHKTVKIMQKCGEPTHSKRGLALSTKITRSAKTTNLPGDAQLPKQKKKKRDIPMIWRVDAMHNSSEEEEGPWVADDLTRIWRR